jgi:CRP/FNR family transcriptional regulator, cyclic AMP receptor protein
MPDGAVTHRLVRALRGVPEFASLDDRSVLRILGASANLFWPEGSTIFRQGSPAEGLYVVLSGEVLVTEDVEGREVETARIGPGDYFGEASLLRDSTHSKSARAETDTELMVLPKDSFRALLESTPELDKQVRQKMERRAPADAAGEGGSGSGP